MDAASILASAQALLAGYVGDQRPLLKQLQLLQKCAPPPAPFAEFCGRLWGHAQLLDDCIMVAGLVFMQHMPCLDVAAEAARHAHSDWVLVALVRGAMLAGPQAGASFLAESLACTHRALEGARFVLVARNLENLAMMQALIGDADLLLLIGRCLRLNSDLVEHKIRDLVRARLGRLVGTDVPDASQGFLVELLAALPRGTKLRLQIEAMILDLGVGCASIHGPILDNAIESLPGKGLTNAAVECLWRLSAQLPHPEPLINRMALLLQGISCSKALGKLAFAISDRFGKSPVKPVLLSRLSGSALDVLSLCFDAECMDVESERFNELLMSGDEFIAYTAFECLVRNGAIGRPRGRKPSEPITQQVCRRVGQFVLDCAFSASVDVRKSVLACSKCFYEQLFGRLYHLAKPRNANAEEYSMLLAWLASFARILVTGDVATMPYATAEHLLSQLIAMQQCRESVLAMDGANCSVLERLRIDLAAAFSFLSHQQTISSLLRVVTDCTFDSLRPLVMQLATHGHWPESVIDESACLDSLRSPRTSKNEAAARALQLRLLLLDAEEGKRALVRYGSVLLGSFELLKASFPDSIPQHNTNGLVLLMRLLIDEMQFDLEPGYLVDLLNASMDISKYVAGIASHPSPEGLDLDSQLESLDLGEDDDANGDVAEDSLVTGQLALTFSWRAIKEISQLMACIISKHRGLLPGEMIDRVLEHLIEHMLTLRHRGAFSSIEAPLAVIIGVHCDFERKRATLDRILRACLETGDISTTRRSAGLPHAILAVLHGCHCRSSDLRPLVEAAIVPILACLESKLDVASTGSCPLVIHSFNILRALVRDARISAEMAPFLHRAARICLCSFSAVNWSIRNASSMLLSAIIIRVFGSTHLNEDESGMDGLVDVRDVEAKFSGFINVLSDAISQSMAADIDPRLAYPLLAILQRLCIPKQERFGPLKTAIERYLFDLVEKMSLKPEVGRKLAFVIGRTVARLQLDAASIIQQQLSESEHGFPNKFRNFCIVAQCCSMDLTPFLKAKQRSDMQVFDECNSERELSLELSLACPSYVNIVQILRACSQHHWSLSATVLVQVIDRFKLNEDVIEPTLQIFARVASQHPLFLESLQFYSACEANENLRWICLRALAAFPGRGHYPAGVVLSLLFDDDEDIRNAMAQLLGPFKLAEAIRRFLQQQPASVVDEFNAMRLAPRKGDGASEKILFEAESLNTFCAVNWLSEHEMVL